MVYLVFPYPVFFRIYKESLVGITARENEYNIRIDCLYFLIQNLPTLAWHDDIRNDQIDGILVLFVKA